jgi:hypothetical protein
MESERLKWGRCTRCFRSSCHTWQTEKKKLMEDQQNESG